VEARSKYFANKSAAALPPSTTPSGTDSVASSITKSTASPSTSLPHQYSGDARKSNVATTQEASDSDADTASPASIDEDVPDITAITADDSATDLHNILHMLSVKQHDRVIGIVSTCHLDYFDRLAHLAVIDGWTHTISDSGADTWVCGNGFVVLYDTGRKVNLQGYDTNSTKKYGLPL